MKQFCKKIKETLIGFKQELELLPSYEDIKDFDVEKVREIYKQTLLIYDKYPLIYLLNLNENVITKLFNALKDSQVTELDLRGNQIRDEGANAIAEALKDSQITWLYLSNNQIEAEGAKAIAEALKDSQVTELWLNDNQIGDEGAKAIAEALKDSQVTVLYLWSNQIGDDVVKEIKEITDRGISVYL